MIIDDGNDDGYQDCCDTDYGDDHGNYDGYGDDNSHGNDHS